MVSEDINSVVPHISEMPHDKVNIEGFCLSGWNTREFYYLPLANLYFLKFLKGTHTFVIKRGSKATDNTVGVSWSCPGSHRSDRDGASSRGSHSSALHP